MTLAALTQSTPPPGGEPAPEFILAPPVWVLPYPLWMVIGAGLLALALLALVIWQIVKRIKNRPPPLPPSAASIALAALEKLRARVNELPPYEFSFAVSDVLRTFVSEAKFRLPATRQTSLEFLTAVSASPLFSREDRTLLGNFLEKCDMIKFARIEATAADSTELVASATEFVRGGRVTAAV